jgi:hypothetical protein
MMGDSDGWPEMKEFIHRTPEGYAIEFVTVGPTAVAEQFSFAELGPVLAAEGVVGLLGVLARPGVTYLQRYLELYHFAPGKPGRASFRCFVLRWCDLLWSLTVFPRAAVDGDVLLAAIERAGLVGRQRVPVAQVSPVSLFMGSVPVGVAIPVGDGFVSMDLPFERVLLLANPPDHLCYRDLRASMDQELEMMAALDREWDASR